MAGPPEADDTPNGSPEPEADAPSEEAGRRTPLTQQLGRIAVVVLLVVFVVFALDNAQHVDFSWLVGGTEVQPDGGERVAGGVRLIVLLLAAFLVGAAVGGTLVAARRRARRKARRD